jgi:PKD domain
MLGFIPISTAPISDLGVTGPPPVYTTDFTFMPLTGNVPLTVNFTNTSTVLNAVDTQQAWSWDFGDGGTSTQQNPSYVFSIPGIFSVHLTVTWLVHGNVGPTAHSITVNAPVIIPPGPQPPPLPPVVSLDSYIALIIPEHNSGLIPVPQVPILGRALIQEGAEGSTGSGTLSVRLVGATQERIDVVTAVGSV